MTQQHATIPRGTRSGWLLTNAAIHEAFHRDLGQLLATTASRRAVRARWNMFCDQLRFHLGAEDAALWPPVQVKLTGDPADLALVEAMKDEHQLIEPVLTAIDEAFTVNTSTEHLRELLTRLHTTLSGHLATRGSRGAATGQRDHVQRGAS